MFNVEWKENAVRELSKLEKGISLRIYKKVDELKENFNHADIKRLKNSNLFRLRVGDYRVLFEVNSTTIIILKIGHRKNIYDVRN
jgi:mRNA interferase RelE/StbE